MVKSHYSIHGFAGISCNVGKRIAKVLDDNFKFFKNEEPPKFRIQIEEVKLQDLSKVERSLGNIRKKSFHKINDVFIISVDGEQLFLNKLDLQKKKIEISCTSGFNEPLLILMVEYFLRLAAIEYEIILCTQELYRLTVLVNYI